MRVSQAEAAGMQVKQTALQASVMGPVASRGSATAVSEADTAVGEQGLEVTGGTGQVRKQPARWSCSSAYSDLQL